MFLEVCRDSPYRAELRGVRFKLDPGRGLLLVTSLPITRSTGRCLVAPGLQRVPPCAAFCTRMTAKIARILRRATYFWKFRPA